MAEPVKVPIGFPEPLYEWLRRRAFVDRTSMAEIVRTAVDEYRQRVDPQLPLPIEEKGR